MKKFLKYYFFLFSFILYSCNDPGLPVLNIIVDGPVSWEEKIPCRLIYSYENDSMVLTGGIKARGGLSSRYGKHSWSLELDRKFSLCGLPPDDDWVINANYIDKTFMRHCLSYDIFREMSAANLAPLSSFAEVKLNGRYNGLYVIMEEVNAGMIGLNRKDEAAVLFKDPPVFFEEILPWVQEEGNYYQQKYPQKDERDMNPVMDDMKEFLFHTSDKDFITELDPWFDLSNVIDWHIMILLSNNGDGVRKNFFLYRKQSGEPFFFALWDYDHSFGRDGDNELNMMERETGWKRAVLLKRLSEIPEINYKSMVADRWFELRKKGIVTERNFNKYLDGYDKKIRNYTAKNFEKWPPDDKWYYDGNSYGQEVLLMKKYVSLRIPYLDKYFRAWKEGMEISEIPLKNPGQKNQPE